ncbi:unnamed protein product [Heligmosomoides polygyrus]|uniref:Galectin n=1 Tax=Heligmosomoides polygyrus TaxID=6339 RepID=A0A183GER8_HELPZ|nr:unnamed protein product [Heligmosomoides polygyrus]
MADKKKPLYDSWTNQQVHTNFPQNAVRVIGQPNMYVALWHHNGKPVMGKAWNDSGVVQVELKHFQLSLTIPSTKFLRVSTGNDVKRELVCCESAAPIFWKEKGLLGNFKTDEQKAEFEESGRFCEVNFLLEVTDATTLGNMLVIVRNIGTGPPGCTCAQCAVSRVRPLQATLPCLSFGHPKRTAGRF